MDNKPMTCHHCGSDNLREREVSAVGGYGPDLLPKLGGRMFSPAKFHIVVCAECGFCHFFANADALKKLPDAKGWKRVN